CARRKRRPGAARGDGPTPHRPRFWRTGRTRPECRSGCARRRTGCRAGTGSDRGSFPIADQEQIVRHLVRVGGARPGAVAGEELLFGLTRAVCPWPKVLLVEAFVGVRG